MNFVFPPHKQCKWASLAQMELVPVQEYQQKTCWSKIILSWWSFSSFDWTQHNIILCCSFIASARTAFFTASVSDAKMFQYTLGIFLVQVFLCVYWQHNSGMTNFQRGKIIKSNDLTFKTVIYRYMAILFSYSLTLRKDQQVFEVWND